jgi:hypothetical protein
MGSRKSARVVFSGGRHLGLRNIGALTCSGGNGLTRLAKGCSGVPDPAAPRDVRGLDSTELSPAEKAATLSPPHHALKSMKPCPEKHETGESKGPKPAARRQARGRWRLDDRKVVRRGPRNRRKRGSQGRSEEPTTGGFSHGGRRTVSEGDVSAGARGAKRRL